MLKYEKFTFFPKCNLYQILISLYLQEGLLPSQLVDKEYAEWILERGYQCAAIIGERLLRIQLSKLSDSGEDEEQNEGEPPADDTSIDEEDEDDSGEQQVQEETETTSSDDNVIGSPLFVAVFKQRKLAYEQKQQQERAKRKIDELAVMRSELYQGLRKWRVQNAVTLTDYYQKWTNDKGAQKRGSRSATLELIHGTVANMLEEDQYPAQIRELLANLILLPVSNSRVERIFSHLKLLFSERRYNLKGHLVKELMYLGFNNLVPKSNLTDFLS